ncbi:MAG: phenylalanyl-tRNA synthetase beta chain [Alphaproteobacteria bacterium]|nr:phenylalanyl-tRNA synthetase beta chain [Alphaproteobacteria bacterium]
MKFTLSWLREHLDTSAGADEIAEKLTAIGLEVESVQDRAAALKSFITAKIISAETHPNADRLRLCMVDTGREQVQVVCGAPNARAGLVGVFAPAGATIPANGMVLKASKIRGVDSNGMMCSASELGISEDHDGIIELASDAPLGAPVAQIMGLDDPVIDVSITPNRPDCLGVHGIARDLAAAGMGMLKSGAVPPQPGNGPCTVDIGLRFDGAAPPACPVFAGRLVRGVKNGPSPDWLRQRLEAIGLRSISTLVDITNYISFDRGRPLHVYDADKLRGQIHARLGRTGEKLLALDGNEYEIDSADCVIADDNGVLALGGVIGGMASGCSDATVNVFIESAWFDPLRIAATGRRHGIGSDARYRFERGVDPQFVVPGLELATRMIMQLCGGAASDVRIAGAPPAPPEAIEFRPERVRALTGMEVSDVECVRILDALGFAVEADTRPMGVRAPSWRPDVHGESDLVEEVARINGFDKLPATPLPRVTPISGIAVSLPQNRVRWAKRLLAGRGMMEAVTWSFISPRMAEMFGGGAKELTLANPISTELAVMRPSLLPNLLAAAKRNADRGMSEIALFEVGPQYAGDAPQDQSMAASGIRCAQNPPRHWSHAGRGVDVFDVKADALAALEQLGAPVDRLKITADAPGWYHPGRSGVIRLGPKNALACFGEVHPAILEALDLRGAVMAFEIVLDAIPLPKSRGGPSRTPLRSSGLQPVTRDFAFLVDSAVTADQVLRAAASSAPDLITDVSLFDLYEGERIGAGRKSLAISVTLQPREKTLTDKEIDAIAEAVIAGVKKATGGELRG